MYKYEAGFVCGDWMCGVWCVVMGCVVCGVWWRGVASGLLPAFVFRKEVESKNKGRNNSAK